jgi:murein DD-endopeptidase MepM/ murein hydrolase activator NlpD
MSKIKTKTTVKNIKALDKAADVGKRMKNAFIRSKGAVQSADRQAEATQQTPQDNPESYATDTISGGAQVTAQEAAHRFKNPQKKVTENVNKAKAQFQKARQQMPKARKQAAEQAKQTAENAKTTADKLGKTASEARKTTQEAQKSVSQAKQTLQQTRQAGRQTVQAAKQSVRTGKQAEKTIKATAKTAKSTAKGTIKTVKKSVKTAERTAKTTVKTAKQTAKAAQKSAQAAAKAAKLAAQASKAAAKAAVQAAKLATKAVIAMVKAAIAAIKGLVALIAAGGWIAVVIIIVICLIGLLVGSIFGVFFSGEDSGTGRSMPSVVSELTTEFYNKVEEIKTNNTHDVVDMNAMSINWPQVLAVYAVKVNTDPDNPAEVATLDDSKVGLLRGVLNDMATLKSELKTETQERTVTTTNADGSITESTETVTIIRLIISLEQKSADDMATQYGFSQTQKDQMHELLSPDYADLWVQLLGGYSGGAGEIGIADGSHIPKDIFDWPIGEGFSITSGYGYRKDPFTGETKFHSGQDIAAPEGTPILAAADGTVIIANSTDSWGGGYGYHVKIQHSDTYATLYAHCSRIAVVNGQEVKKGQVIAYVGTTGNSTGNHLHFEVWKDGVRTNPMGYYE